MFACTEPDGSGIGAVHVECGGQTWPTKKLTHARTQIFTQTEKLFQGTLPPYANRYEEAVFPWKPKKKRLARLITIVNGRSLLASMVSTNK